jgi:hypothetical protein
MRGFKSENIMEDKVPGHGRPTVKLRRYRWLFIAAALWNWLVALISLVADEEIRSLLRMPPGADSLNLHLSISCICLLGIGYYWVAKDVSRNHAIVRLGIIGKVAVFSILLGHAIRGDIPYTLAAPGVIDLVFAVLFLEFLMRMHSAEGAATNDTDLGS